jgi:hypothetical protein
VLEKGKCLMSKTSDDSDRCGMQIPFTLPHFPSTAFKTSPGFLSDVSRFRRGLDFRMVLAADYLDLKPETCLLLLVLRNQVKKKTILATTYCFDRSTRVAAFE